MFRSAFSSMRALTSVLAACVAAAGFHPGEGALARSDGRLQQEETVITCKNITPKKQLVLERRALGGDPRAQFVLAYCAWPLVGQPKPGAVENPEERYYGNEKRIMYAHKWATIAYCDQEYNDLEEETRSLERENRIFERREPARDLRGLAERQREKERQILLEIRKEVNDALYQLSDDDAATDASKKFVNQMEGLGASGLASLALMRDCPNYPDYEQRHVRGGLWYNLGRLIGLNFETSQRKFELEADQKERDAFRISSLPNYKEVDTEEKYRIAAVAAYKASVGRPDMPDQDIPREVRQRISRDWDLYFRNGVATRDWNWPIDEVKLWVEALVVEGRELDRTLMEEFIRAYTLLGRSSSSSGNRFENMGKVPVQYLQLALGAFRKVDKTFPQGLKLSEFRIDNIYGQKTADLVKQAQMNYCVIRDVALSEDALRDVANSAPQDQGGKELEKATEKFDIDPYDDCTNPEPGKGRSGAEEAEYRHPDYNNNFPTGWLTPRQARALICRAAVDRNDPYSYLHLAQMFSEGFGYGVDFDRALYAVKQARLILRLEPRGKVSNHGDLWDKPLGKRYVIQAKALEDSITRKAAQRYLGVTIEEGEKVDSGTLKRLNNRLDVARYDEPGALCGDEKWVKK